MLGHNRLYVYWIFQVSIIFKWFFEKPLAFCGEFRGWMEPTLFKNEHFQMCIWFDVLISIYTQTIFVQILQTNISFKRQIKDEEQYS